VQPPLPPDPPAWAALARLVLGARWLPWAFLALVLGGLAALPRLSFDFSPQTLFDSTSERARVYREHRARYGADDHILLVLVEADLARADTWALIADLESDIAALPAVDRVGSLVSAAVPRNVDGAIAIAPLSGDAPPATDAEAAALLAQAQDHPLLRNTLVAPSGKVASIVLKVGDDVEKIAEVRPVIDALHGLMDRRAAEHPGSRLHLLGPHAYRTTVVGVMIREEMRFAPLTAVLLALVLGLLFRSVQGVLIPLLSVGLGALWTLALMALTGEPVNIINTITATLILVIGVADAIHMMERFGQEQSLGLDRRAAVRKALLWVGGACLLTSLTTAVGFATLSTANLAILRRFGLYSAAGVMITFVTTIVFVPWALDRFGLGARDHSLSAFDRATDRALRRQGELVRAHPRAVALVGLAVTAVFAAGIPRTTIDNFIMEYVPRGEPILAAHHLLEDELAGVVFLDVVLDVEGEAPTDPWMEPELLGRAQRAVDSILAHPRVHSAESPLGVLSELRFVQRGGAEAGIERTALPGTRQEAASLMLLAEMGPDESVARTHLSTDRRRMRITFRAGDLGAQGYLALEAQMTKTLQDAFAGSPVAVRGFVTGTSQVGYAGIDSLIRDLLRSLGWAFVLIFLTLVVLFRSWRIAALAMVPNLAPILVVLGAMGWAHQHLETLSAMVFSIGLGIAVDDTIHYVARYCQEVRLGFSPEEAVQRTTEHTGRAIITTSLVLLFGFGVLFTSAFPPNKSFAVLASAVIGAALIADLWMLPALLLWVRPPVPGAPRETV
jgi:predicted RND superfamily exporter protein